MNTHSISAIDRKGTSMNVEHYQRLFDYNRWANKRIWRCVQTLTEAQFTQPFDYSIGSICAQLNHQVGVEWLFYMRVTQQPNDGLPPVDQYPTRQALHQRWQEVDALWDAYLPTLTDDLLEEDLTFISVTTGTTKHVLRWEALTQMINHSTDHRAQILSAIHQTGSRQTLAQDFIYYVWALD